VPAARDGRALAAIDFAMQSYEAAAMGSGERRDLPGSGPVQRGMLRTLDRVLRGVGEPGGERLQGVALRSLVALAVLLAVVYGASLGTYGLGHAGDQPWLQLLAAAVKMPLLFALTLVVTFPSLYVFGALTRAPLAAVTMLRLLLVAIVVDAAILASLGPVFAFFAASTQSYPFLLLLHVLFCAIGGVVALLVLQRLSAAALPAAGPGKQQGMRLLTVWGLLYGTVGAQMGWLLRPFLLAPGHQFTWLRPRDSNFFEAAFAVLRDLLHGG